MENKKEQFIPREDLLTPKEHRLIGGTTEEGNWPEDVPFGITYKRMPIAEIAEGRRRLANFPDPFIGHALGYGRAVVIQFPEIDPEDGHVLEEPRFIGFWDKDKKEVILAKDPEEFDKEVKGKIEELMRKKERGL